MSQPLRTDTSMKGLAEVVTLWSFVSTDLTSDEYRRCRLSLRLWVHDNRIRFRSPLPEAQSRVCDRSLACPRDVAVIS